MKTNCLLSSLLLLKTPEKHSKMYKCHNTLSDHYKLPKNMSRNFFQDLKSTSSVHQIFLFTSVSHTHFILWPLKIKTTDLTISVTQCLAILNGNTYKMFFLFNN